MESSARPGEGILSIVQNNRERTLRVTAMDETLSAMLGYPRLLEPISFFEIAGEQTAELLREELDFDEDGVDFNELFAKQRHIYLKDAKGNEQRLVCRTARAVAMPGCHCFNLIVMDQDATHIVDTAQQRGYAFHQACSGYEGQDPETGLHSHEAMRHYINLACTYSAAEHTRIACVYMQPEEYQEVIAAGLTTFASILHHVGSVIQRNLRAYDKIGRIDTHSLAALLLNINPETVHLVLNRLPHMLYHDPVRLADNSTFIPTLRQSCVLLDNIGSEHVIPTLFALLESDPTRNLLVYH